jgi:hypothetical protein
LAVIPPMPKCLLIGDKRGRFPLTTAQMVRLRDLPAEFYSVAPRSLPEIAPGPDALLVITHDRMGQLGPSALRTLRTWVEAGTILYLRGGVESGQVFSLEPFAPLRVRLYSERLAVGYRITRHSMVPNVLREESAEGRFAIPGADIGSAAVESVMNARHADGVDRAAIFTVRCGAGIAIYDLHSDEESFDIPIADRLANPFLRPAVLGPLIAVDRAANRDVEQAAAFNITLDDRPANIDFFNVGNLRQFLERVRERVPDGSVDFAWTPNQSHPSHRYLKTMTDFHAGFVWHGFLRHVDHSAISDPAAELTHGKRMVDLLTHRFGVSFQPVMVFPFERDTPQCVDLLRRHGFRAKVETVPEPWTRVEGDGRFIDFSRPERINQSGEFVVLYRKAVERMDRDWMLAVAALGMPVLSATHPEDFGLERFARNPWRMDSFDELDRVLDFAAEKSLRPASLGEIAEEIIGH